MDPLGTRILTIATALAVLKRKRQLLELHQLQRVESESDNQLHCNLTENVSCADQHREEARKGREPSIPSIEICSTAAIDPYLIAENASFDQQAKFLLCGLFWAAEGSPSVAADMASRLNPLVDAIMTDASFWSEYQVKLKRCIFAPSENRIMVAIQGGCAIVRATANHPHLSQAFEFQRRFIHYTIEVMGHVVSSWDSPESDGLAVHIGSDTGARRLSKLCMVLKEGMGAAAQLACQIDRNQVAPIQSLSNSFQAWMLNRLAQLLVQSAKLPALASSIHCLAEEVEFGFSALGPEGHLSRTA